LIIFEWNLGISLISRLCRSEPPVFQPGSPPRTQRRLFRRRSSDGAAPGPDQPTTRRRCVLALVLALSFATAPVAAGPFEDGEASYERGDYTTALRLYRPLAEQGNASAQFEIGRMYFNGHGVPQNFAEALKWHRLAADQGNVKAQVALGIMYYIGQSVRRNLEEARKWFRLAADQSDSGAQAMLGAMYVNGAGVPKNYIEAMKWFRLSADQGDDGFLPLVARPPPTQALCIA